MISGSSDRAIVDLQQGDYEELDQMNAAKPYAKAAFRVNQPQDLALHWHALSGSLYQVALAEFIMIAIKCLAATMEKDSVNHDC